MYFIKDNRGFKSYFGKEFQRLEASTENFFCYSSNNSEDQNKNNSELF